MLLGHQPQMLLVFEEDVTFELRVPAFQLIQRSLKLTQRALFLAMFGGLYTLKFFSVSVIVIYKNILILDVENNFDNLWLLINAFRKWIVYFLINS